MLCEGKSVRPMKPSRSWMPSLIRLDERIFPQRHPIAHNPGSDDVHDASRGSRSWLAIPRPGGAPPQRGLARLLYMLDSHVIRRVDHTATGALLLFMVGTYVAVGLIVGLLIGRSLLLVILAVFATGWYPLVSLVVNRRRSTRRKVDGVSRR